MEDLMSEFDMEMTLQALRTEHEEIEDFTLDEDQMMVVYDEDEEDDEYANIHNTESGLMDIMMSTCMKFNTPINSMTLYMLIVLVRTLNQMDGYVAIGSVQKISFMYILPRWTKNAKKDIWDTLYGNHCLPTGLKPPRISTLTWRQSMERKFYNLVLKSQSNEEARKAVETLYNATIDEVNKIIEKNSNEIEDGAENSQASTALQITQVRDPERMVTKGRKKRLKGHFETSQKKGSNSSAQRDPATQTRNKHII